MIEMRWFQCRQGWEDLDHNYSIIKRTLQFREGGYNEVDRATGKHLWVGSDWQDVPTITGEPPAAPGSGQGGSNG